MDVDVGMRVQKVANALRLVSREVVGNDMDLSMEALMSNVQASWWN